MNDTQKTFKSDRDQELKLNDFEAKHLRHFLNKLYQPKPANLDIWERTYKSTINLHKPWTTISVPFTGQKIPIKKSYIVFGLTALVGCVVFNIGIPNIFTYLNMTWIPIYVSLPLFALLAISSLITYYWVNDKNAINKEEMAYKHLSQKYSGDHASRIKKATSPPTKLDTVSYTHLTLPTILLV